MVNICIECGKPAEFVRCTAFENFFFCKEHAELESDFMGTGWQIVPPSPEAEEYERLRQAAENQSIDDLIPPMDAGMPEINPNMDVVEATLKYMGQSIPKKVIKSGELMDERKKILSDVWLQVYCATIRRGKSGDYTNDYRYIADSAAEDFEERFLKD